LASRIDQVRAFWEAEPCADRLASAPRGTERYYAEIATAKERMEPHAAEFADFPSFAGRDVLELGCGIGVHTAAFAQAGAIVTACDLTEAGVSLAREQLRLVDVSGTVLVADAEHLPFPDSSFDLVWSWGVIHHTPDPARAVGEIQRVLRPEGETRVMLYSARSVAAVAVWARQLVRERRPMGLQQAAARGLESPGTRVFTQAQARLLFAGFESVEVRQVATVYDRLRIAQLGWHILVRATGP
jgi:SAM-dependent methyltransferase